MNTPQYLVRHGNYEISSHNLTAEGRTQSEKGRDDLLSRGIGGKALLLSSDAKRTIQTAEIIAEGLGVDIHPSTRINRAGNSVGVVSDLDEFLATTLERMGLDLDEDRPLVVVTHAPMIAISEGINVRDCNSLVSYGGVYEYAPGSWSNPEYRDFEELLYSDDLAGK